MQNFDFDTVTGDQVVPLASHCDTNVFPKHQKIRLSAIQNSNASVELSGQTANAGRLELVLCVNGKYAKRFKFEGKIQIGGWTVSGTLSVMKNKQIAATFQTTGNVENSVVTHVLKPGAGSGACNNNTSRYDIEVALRFVPLRKGFEPLGRTIVDIASAECLSVARGSRPPTPYNNNVPGNVNMTGKSGLVVAGQNFVAQVVGVSNTPQPVQTSASILESTFDTSIAGTYTLSGRITNSRTDFSAQLQIGTQKLPILSGLTVVNKQNVAVELKSDNVWTLALSWTIDNNGSTANVVATTFSPDGLTSVTKTTEAQLDKSYAANELVPFEVLLSATSAGSTVDVVSGNLQSEVNAPVQLMRQVAGARVSLPTTIPAFYQGALGSLSLLPKTQLPIALSPLVPLTNGLRVRFDVGGRFLRGERWSINNIRPIQERLQVVINLYDASGKAYPFTTRIQLPATGQNPRPFNRRRPISFIITMVIINNSPSDLGVSFSPLVYGDNVYDGRLLAFGPYQPNDTTRTPLVPSITSYDMRVRFTESYANSDSYFEALSATATVSI